MIAPGSTAHLTADEEQSVAADLARCWTGLTGSNYVPSAEALVDLVQRVQRKARQVVTSRAAGA